MDKPPFYNSLIQKRAIYSLKEFFYTYNRFRITLGIVATVLAVPLTTVIRKGKNVKTLKFKGFDVLNFK